MMHQHNTSGAEPTGTSSEATAFTAVPFDEVLRLRAACMRRRTIMRQLRVLKTVIMLLAVAALTVGLYPTVVQLQSARRLQSVAVSSEQDVASWPADKVDQVLAAARDYNARLAQSGQPQLGEGADPFTTSDGRSADVGGAGAGGDAAASGADSSAADYESQLAGSGGVMGTVRVPKISVELPIYHGTSDAALASGAGHLYGTSLPVGGPSTHAVITGHRGLATAQMFTRLNEIEIGDYLYITVMDRTLAYEVDSIDVIDPTDSSRLRIVPGQDRLTLMTCTPYGVNTHRLLVSGHRVPYPADAPEPSAVADVRRELHVIWAVLAACTVLAFMAERRRSRWMPRRHAAQ
ncbi:class C sortase [Pseudoscardovia suis]|uniref:class C sortase n=1 Tax=Pseudoscardovia suis TaxID=987063 RepID=UPI003F98B092